MLLGSVGAAINGAVNPVYAVLFSQILGVRTPPVMTVQYVTSGVVLQVELVGLVTLNTVDCLVNLCFF